MTKKQDGKDKSKAGVTTTELNAAELEKATGGTIGSATGGAGAGKAKFNEFSVTRKTDVPTPR